MWKGVATKPGIDGRSLYLTRTMALAAHRAVRIYYEREGRLPPMREDLMFPADEFEKADWDIYCEYGIIHNTTPPVDPLAIAPSTGRFWVPMPRDDVALIEGGPIRYLMFDDCRYAIVLNGLDQDDDLRALRSARDSVYQDERSTHTLEEVMRCKWIDGQGMMSGDYCIIGNACDESAANGSVAELTMP